MKQDWMAIQKEYDSGTSYDQLIKIFKISTATLNRAKKKGLFKPRSMSEGIKLYKKLNPEKIKHSSETKIKISTARKLFIEKNPDKVPYRLYHYAKHKPYTETYFIELFKKENINLKFHLDVGIYELDFYNKEAMLCVEIDGNQHYYDKRIIESDIRRTKYLEKLGWTVVRIRWSEYKKKTYEEKKQVIEYIKNTLELLQNELQA
jgi:very-short-patch-repair endonuclease